MRDAGKKLLRMSRGKKLVVGDDFEFKCCCRIAAGLSKRLQMSRTKNFDQLCFVRVDPGDGGQAARCAVNALLEVLVEDDGDDASEEALDEVEDVVDGRTDFSNIFKDVAVEDHLPLDSSFWREKRAGMDGQLKLQFWTGGEVH